MTHCFEDPWRSGAASQCHRLPCTEDSGTIKDVDFESVEDQNIARLKEMACGISVVGYPTQHPNQQHRSSVLCHCRV